MIMDRSRFNLYLLLSCAALLAAGCKTADDSKKDTRTKEEKKLTASLHVHISVTPDSMDFSMPVTVFRAQPMTITVDRSPILTEAFISEAKVVDDKGAFMLQIQFEKRGVWMLEQYTTTQQGKHLVIFSQFGPKLKESRWLAAPTITRRISNGVLTFTPDATREEAELIAKGLNNVAEKIRKDEKW